MVNISMRLLIIILIIIILIISNITKIYNDVYDNFIGLIGSEELSRTEFTMVILYREVTKSNSSKESYSLTYRWENETGHRGMIVSKQVFDNIEIVDRLPAEQIVYKLRDGRVKSRITVDSFKYNTRERIRNFIFERLVN
jgi:hypothetical protein